MKFYTPVFSLTLLLSATLLFSVQPMFSKMILPMLGGTPQVWNTAMLFFQACLLGGYGYAHLTSRYLKPQVQAVLHVFLLLVFTVILPLAIPAGWEPSLEHDPTFWQLSIMTAVVGGPFFVVSGSAPMLQHWFASTDHKDADNPYFLYGASNLGSMAALFSYPTVIEPLFGLEEQSGLWMYGYFGLIILTNLCVILIWKNAKSAQNATTINTVNEPKITTKQRAKWIILSFVPSSLMLGVTTYITTDIATVPLLWIIPFALYVATFIIVFARKQILSEPKIMALSALALILLIFQMTAFKEQLVFIPLALVAIHIITFFIISLACHFDLAQSKPTSSHLTEFYFFMSLGGVLGGFFNAIIAPKFFILPIEYALALAIAMFLRYSNTQTTAALKKIHPAFYLLAIATAATCYSGFFFIEQKKFFMASLLLGCATSGVMINYMKDRWRFAIISSLIILISPLGIPVSILNEDLVLKRERNFFGVHKIVETEKERMLVNGMTNHGTQPKDPAFSKVRISYYSPGSPLTDVFNYLDQKTEPQIIGALGLGIGVVTCYSHPDRFFQYFEIDKDIADIAEDPKYFTYLSGCGSPYEIVIGDGRLEIAKQQDKKYDAIVIDVFSSDNIPVHIMTADAIAMYMKKMKDNGVLVIHISNRYLDLEPVFTAIGQELKIPMYARATHKSIPIADTGINSFPAHFVVFTHSQEAIAHLKNSGWTSGFMREGVRAWTDKYSNIISVFGNYTGGLHRQLLEIKQDKEKAALEKKTEEVSTETQPVKAE